MDKVSVDERLRGAGLKVTEPRRSVLNILCERGQHLDAEAVHERVRETLPKASLQTVYGVLGALTEAGLLRRIEPAGSAALYETRIGDNHHHLVCTNCNQVTDIDCVVGEAPCLTPDNDRGYDIQSAEVTFWGLCPNCRATTAA